MCSQALLLMTCVPTSTPQLPFLTVPDTQSSKRPHKHKDPTKHDFWYPPSIGRWSQNLRCLCLCRVLGPKYNQNVPEERRIARCMVSSSPPALQACQYGGLEESRPPHLKDKALKTSTHLLRRKCNYKSPNIS